MISIQRIFLFSFLFPLVMSEVQLSSAIMLWQGVQSQVFNQGSSWQGEVAPGSADTARFTNDYDGILTFDANITNTALSFRNMDGEIHLNLGGYSYTVTGDLDMGREGSSNHVSVSGGTLEFGRLYLGYSENTANSLELRGAGSEMKTAGVIRLGESANAGNTSLLVHEGAVLDSDSNINIGFGQDSRDNELLIRSGGQVNIGTNARIGSGTGAESNKVEVSGEGSELIVGTTLSVGFVGSDNRLEILSGGYVKSNALNIGSSSASHNVVRIHGEDSQLEVVQQVRIGDSGSSNQLVVESGGELTLTGTSNFVLGYSETSQNNQLWIHGGTVNAGQRTLLVNHGDVNLADGGELNVSQLQLGANGKLSGAGSVTGNVSALATGARVEIGNNDYGVMHVVGDWQNENILLTIKVGEIGEGSLAGEEYDYLDIAGIFYHGGVIEIDVFNSLSSGTTQVQLLSWLSESGFREETSVVFIGSSFYSYEWQNDGLYIQAIPEPSVYALWAVVLGGVLLRRKRRKSNRNVIGRNGDGIVLE